MKSERKRDPLIVYTYRIALAVIYAIFIRPNGWWMKNASDPSKVQHPQSSDSKPQLWLERSSSDTKLSDAGRQY